MWRSIFSESCCMNGLCFQCSYYLRYWHPTRDNDFFPTCKIENKITFNIKLPLYFVVLYQWFLTNPFSNREIWPQNILWADENNISDVKVVGGHKNTTKLLFTWTSMESKSRCNEANCIFPNSWMPYYCDFLESFGLLIWIIQWP